jgi:hypothetical protein
MWTPQDEERLLRRQDNVYELLDVATKPAQWFLGGLKLLLLAVIIVAVLVGTPFYYWFTGGTVTADMVLNAVLALSTLVLFFLCPWYVVVGGVLFWVSFGFWLDAHPDQTVFQSPRNMHLGFVLFGYGQYAVRLAIKHLGKPSYSGIDIPSIQVSDVPNGETLTPGSPIPDHQGHRLNGILESMNEDMEAVLDKPERCAALLPQVADIDQMPLNDALNATNVMVAAVASRMRELADAWSAGTYHTREDAARDAQEFLATQQRVITRLTAVIARLKRENFPYPTFELEESVAHLRAMRARVVQIALAKGLI